MKSALTQIQDATLSSAPRPKTTHCFSESNSKCPGVSLTKDPWVIPTNGFLMNYQLSVSYHKADKTVKECDLYEEAYILFSRYCYGEY